LQFATIHGAALHHSHRPRGDGRPTLVFINSLGTDFRIWDAVAADLGDTFPLLRYDKRGHGLSGSEGGDSIDAHAAPCVTIRIESHT